MLYGWQKFFFSFSIFQKIGRIEQKRHFPPIQVISCSFLIRLWNQATIKFEWRVETSCYNSFRSFWLKSKNCRNLLSIDDFKNGTTELKYKRTKPFLLTSVIHLSESITHLNYNQFENQIKQFQTISSNKFKFRALQILFKIFLKVQENTSLKIQIVFEYVF